MGGVGISCWMGATAARPREGGTVVAPANGASCKGSWLACGGVVNSGAMGEVIGAMGASSGVISDEALAAGGELSGPMESNAYLYLLGPFRL